MIGLFLCLQVLVLRAMCGDDPDPTSNFKDYTEYTLKKIIDLYDKARPITLLPNYRCDDLSYNRTYCNEEASCLGTYSIDPNKRRLVKCIHKTSRKKMADPKKWKPHPNCSQIFTVYYKGYFYYKGCKLPEESDGMDQPWCKVYMGGGSKKNCIKIEEKPINGSWKKWISWTDCTKSCGDGQRSRTRECIAPTQGGKECQGEKEESEACGTDECPGWTEWGNWDECSRVCAGGSRPRARICHGSERCIGNASEEGSCNTHKCSHDNSGKMAKMSAKTSSKSNKWYFIIVSFVGCILVVGLIVMIIVICRRRSKNDKEINTMSEIYDETTFYD